MSDLQNLLPVVAKLYPSKIQYHNNFNLVTTTHRNKLTYTHSLGLIESHFSSKQEITD